MTIEWLVCSGSGETPLQIISSHYANNARCACCGDMVGLTQDAGGAYVTLRHFVELSDGEGNPDEDAGAYGRYDSIADEREARS